MTINGKEVKGETMLRYIVGVLTAATIWVGRTTHETALNVETLITTQRLEAIETGLLKSQVELLWQYHRAPVSPGPAGSVPLYPLEQEPPE